MRWWSPWTLPADVLENEAITIADAGVDRGLVRRQVDRPEGLLVDGRYDALVDEVAGRRRRPEGRAAVADVVLGGRQRAESDAAEVGALHAADERAREVADQRSGPRRSPRTSGPIGRPAAPRRPARSPSGCPVAAISVGGRPADPLDEVRVGGGAEPDLVREDRRARRRCCAPWTASTP